MEYELGNVSDFQEGGRLVEIDGVKIAIFKINDAFFAINNSCPHRRGSLCDGDLNGCIVTCPLHGWEFDVTSGESPDRPVSVKNYQVKIENGILKVII